VEHQPDIVSCVFGASHIDQGITGQLENMIDGLFLGAIYLACRRSLKCVDRGPWSCRHAGCLTALFRPLPHSAIVGPDKPEVEASPRLTASTRSHTSACTVKVSVITLCALQGGHHPCQRAVWRLGHKTGNDTKGSLCAWSQSCQLRAHDLAEARCLFLSRGRGEPF